MKRCPITYRKVQDGPYSKTGLHYLNPALEELKPLPYKRDEQLMLADAMMTRISIPGSRPKLNAILSIKNREFVPTAENGSYLLKPEQARYGDQLPQNEDLTMRLASICGIEVPLHGLHYAVDGSMLYMVRRFDRVGRSGKVHTEDFAQVLGKNSQTRYDGSMEEVAEAIDRYCTFPVVEKLKLFRRTLFSLLTGNRDMHLKNLSLIHRDGKIELSPAYDLVNHFVSSGRGEAELALPVQGKQNGIDRSHLFESFGRGFLGLDPKILDSVAGQFKKALPEWRRTIRVSFLSQDNQLKYKELLDRRLKSLR